MKPKGKSLAIIDPGLTMRSGHHAGFAYSLAAGWLPDQQLSAPRFVAHETLDPDIGATLQASGATVVRLFRTNFYQYYDQPGGLSSRAHYVSALALEYRQAILDLPREGQQWLVLYHTLSWEHALALALALQGIERSDCRHVVLLMFCPGIDHRGNVIDRQLTVNFRIGFRQLSRIPRVALYASCMEYAHSYAQLLDSPAPLPVHPCFLIPAHRTRCSSATAGNDDDARQVTLSDSHVLLYFGDAKASKGFCDLPRLLQGLLSRVGQQARITVHHTLFDWSGPAVLQAASELETIAANDQRVQLRPAFLDDRQLGDLLSSSDLFVCNYQEAAYANKSSGILWLAANFAVPMLFLGDTWLLREANRLHPWQLSFPTIEAFLASLNASGVLPMVRRTVDTDYRNSIYRPFQTFLEECSGDPQ